MGQTAREPSGTGFDPQALLVGQLCMMRSSTEEFSRSVKLCQKPYRSRPTLPCHAATSGDSHLVPVKVGQRMNSNTNERVHAAPSHQSQRPFVSCPRKQAWTQPASTIRSAACPLTLTFCAFWHLEQTGRDPYPLAAQGGERPGAHQRTRKQANMFVMFQYLEEALVSTQTGRLRGPTQQPLDKSTQVIIQTIAMTPHGHGQDHHRTILWHSDIEPSISSA